MWRSDDNTSTHRSRSGSHCRFEFSLINNSLVRVETEQQGDDGDAASGSSRLGRSRRLRRRRRRSRDIFVVVAAHWCSLAEAEPGKARRRERRRDDGVETRYHGNRQIITGSLLLDIMGEAWGILLCLFCFLRRGFWGLPSSPHIFTELINLNKRGHWCFGGSEKSNQTDRMAEKSLFAYTRFLYFFTLSARRALTCAWFILSVSSRCMNSSGPMFFFFSSLLSLPLAKKCVSSLFLLSYSTHKLQTKEKAWCQMR